MLQGDAKPGKKVLGGFLLVALVFGVAFIAIRVSNQELPPFWGGALRLMLSAMILFTVMRVQGIPIPRGRALGGAALYGLFTTGFNFALVYWGLLGATAATASVMFATVPLITVVLSQWARLEKWRWSGMGGSAAALLGVAVVFSNHLSEGGSVLSILSIFGGVLSVATGGVVIKLVPRANPISMATVGMLTGTPLLLVLSLIAGERVAFPVQSATWLALGWLVVGTSVGQAVNIWVYSHWTASAASYSQVLIPVVTFVAAWLLNEETVTPVFLAGSALVLVGVYFGTLAQRRNRSAVGPGSSHLAWLWSEPFPGGGPKAREPKTV